MTSPTKLPRSLSRRLSLFVARAGGLALVGLCALVLSRPAAADVFYSRESALIEAFGTGARIESQSVFLDEAQLLDCSRKAKSRCTERIIHRYRAQSADGKALGYAYIDTHPVRSLQETVMVVVADSGEIRQELLLAFHEPQEYLAPVRWLAKFRGRKLADDLQLGRGIDALSGATITANAIAAASRRILAVHELSLSGKN